MKGEAEKPGMVAPFCNLSSPESRQEDKKFKFILCHRSSGFKARLS